MMLISGLLFVVGAALVVFGLILSTDGVEGWHRRRAKRKRPKIPAPGTNGRGGIYKTGCKDCGMCDLPLDCYDRCRLCAELEELRGGVKSVPPMRAFVLASLRRKDSGWVEITEANGSLEFLEPVSGWVWRLTCEGEMVHVRTRPAPALTSPLDARFFAEPPADISGIHMERIG
jgi:hypothetical protein